ncbi:MAG TPA: hypothetical protein VFC19_47385 [Candidatus Limnocylindrales bacterium]|nr:hypothetical protein [Candidatus Limnocylindrales bacterium]
MLDTARLAGFFAAHGIWGVSGGETLIPMLGYEHLNGERGMDRFVRQDVGDGANAGLEALRRNEHNAARAVLVVDGYVHLTSGKTDSLIVEAVQYGAFGPSMKVAVPYRPQPSPLGFAVHRPKFLEIGGVDPSEYQALGEAFFDGVDSHEAAAQVWNAHYDPSL